MAISRGLFGVSIDDITAAVRQQTGNHDLMVTAWSSERLLGGGETLGVWRLSGTAVMQEAPRDWSIGVWLEEVTDGVKGLRTLHDYAMVARRLGQLNGAWVTDRPLPSHPALSRDWTRRWIEAGAPAMDWVTQVADEPLVQRAYPPSILEIYRRVGDPPSRQRAAGAITQDVRSHGRLPTQRFRSE